MISNYSGQNEVAEILESEESVTIERLKRFVSRIPEMNDSLDNTHTISDVIDLIQKHCLSHVHISKELLDDSMSLLSLKRSRNTTNL